MHPEAPFESLTQKGNILQVWQESPPQFIVRVTNMIATQNTLSS
jgi:hypothetical protein